MDQSDLQARINTFSCEAGASFTFLQRFSATKRPGIRSLSSAFSLLFCVGQWCLIWWGLIFGFLVVTHNTCARLVHWCFGSGCAGIVILSWLILQASLFPLCHLRSKPRVGLNTTLRGGGRGAARVTARKRQERDQNSQLLEGLKQLLENFATHDKPPSSAHSGSSHISGLGKGKGWGKGKGGTKDAGRTSKPQSFYEGHKAASWYRWDQLGSQSKSSGNHSDVDSELLSALGKLCQRAVTQPQGLLARVQALVTAASNGKKLGKKKKNKWSQTSTKAPWTPHDTEDSWHDTEPQGRSWAQVVKNNRKSQGAKPPGPEVRLQLMPACSGPKSITSYAVVKKALDEGKAPPGKVVWLNTFQNADDMQGLAKLHEIKCDFALAVLHTDTEMQLPDNAVVKKLAVSDASGNRATFKEFVLLPLAAKLPELPTDSVQESKHTPVERKLACFRISIPEAFVAKDKWKEYCANPGKAIKQWTGTSACFHSSFAWKTVSDRDNKNTQCLSGFIKIDEKQVATLMKRSGTEGVFAERHSAEAPLTQGK